MRQDARPAVKLPSNDEDKPGWGKVGIIAVVGFVIGVAWPKVFGVRVGPNAPGESQVSASASAAPPGEAASAAPEKAEAPKAVASAAPAAPKAAPSAEPVAPAPKPETMVTVGRGSVLTCKTESGDAKKGKDCGAFPALDALVAPRLRKLATCAAAEGQNGKLSVVVTADFARLRLTHDIGKSSTVEGKDGLAACVKTELAGLSLDGVAHEHTRYVVGYNAVFAPRAGAPPPPAAEPAAAKTAPLEAAEAKEPAPKDDRRASDAQVVWDVALVRDVPRTGSIVARLPRGSKVRIGSGKDGWFAVKFGDAFDKDGWLYRGAVGR